MYAFGEGKGRELIEQGSSQLDRTTGRQMDRQTIDTQIWTEMDTWTAKHMDRDGQKDNAPSVPSG